MGPLTRELMGTRCFGVRPRPVEEHSDQRAGVRCVGPIPLRPDVTPLLPKDARIVSTAVSQDHIAVTIEPGGTAEIRTFDLQIVRPTGPLRFTGKLISFSGNRPLAPQH